jgi:receptor-type tyrosine-protein phosphatase N
LNTINIDITTGHVILSYMEEHLNEKNRLEKEWKELCKYEAEPNKADIGKSDKNMNKNRYSDILPYDHTRVKLAKPLVEDNSDYINASYIIDNDPKHPAYITTQGPLSQTTAHFWQMIWEQNSVNIISLCRTVEYGSLKCHQYWPVSGCEVYGNFEVHLVSEHVWCEDYLVRSFYLKNLQTTETRTVTQFHFLTWPENGVPHSIKSILDFRR